MTVIMCGLSAVSQYPSPVTVGMSVLELNDFSQSKRLLVNTDYQYNSKLSSPKVAVYEYVGARYVDEILIIIIYKADNSNKVNGCKILVGEQHLNKFNTQLLNNRYKLLDYTKEPYEVLYEKGEYVVGERINEQGFFEAQFLRYIK